MIALLIRAAKNAFDITVDTLLIPCVFDIKPL